MRGRVSAVNLIFIGASNELGEFESGFTASWFGTVPAVVFGGLGTLAVVALYSWRFPQIRNYDQLKTDAESVKESVTESGEENFMTTQPPRSWRSREARGRVPSTSSS
jgi:hypothetical protein